MTLTILTSLLLTLAVLAWVVVRLRNGGRSSQRPSESVPAPKGVDNLAEPMADDIGALVERVTPLLRAHPGQVLTPAAFLVDGLALEQAQVVCAALSHRPDLARVDLEVYLDGKPAGMVISVDFNVSPTTIAPDITTWRSPRLGFVWRVTPNGEPNTDGTGG